MCMFFLLPIQLVGITVFIVIGQMGLSVAVVNIGSCAVTVVLHHLLFGEFTHVFYYCYCYHQYVPFIAFQVAGVRFILIIPLRMSAVVISIGSYEIIVVLYTSSII